MVGMDRKCLQASVIYLSGNGKPLSEEVLRYRLKDDLGIHARVLSGSEKISLAITDDERKPESMLINYAESLYRVNVVFTLDCSQDFQQIVNRFCSPTKDWQGWLMVDKMVFFKKVEASDKIIVPAHKDINIRPFSFGSLVGMNSFVEHYSSDWSSKDTFGIGSIKGDFLHDIMKLLITFTVIERETSRNRGRRDKPKIFKLEVLYTSINRILVKLKGRKEKGSKVHLYDVYLQLAGTPFIYHLKRDDDHDDDDEETVRKLNEEEEYREPDRRKLPWIRAVSFGKDNGLCSKNVIGLSRVLKFTLADRNAWEVISQLSACCKFAQIFFSPVTDVECRKPFNAPMIEESCFNSLYGLKCVLTCGFEVSDELYLKKNLKEVNELLKKYAKEDDLALAYAFYDIHRMLNQAEVFRFKEAVTDLYGKYRLKNSRGLKSVCSLTAQKDSVENEMTGVENGQKKEIEDGVKKSGKKKHPENDVGKEMGVGEMKCRPAGTEDSVKKNKRGVKNGKKEHAECGVEKEMVQDGVKKKKRSKKKHAKNGVGKEIGVGEMKCTGTEDGMKKNERGSKNSKKESAENGVGKETVRNGEKKHWPIQGLNMESEENCVTSHHKEEIPLLPKKKHTDMIVLRRAFLTPTRLMFLPPLPQMMSYLLRSCDPEYAMRLTLRDDDYDQLTIKLKGSDKQKEQFLHDNFLDTIVKGIKIGDRLFQFFGSSTSQLREHGLLLYANDPQARNAESIRKSLGKLSEIPSVPKYLARMGQSLSQAMTCVEVDRKFCGPKQADIKRGGYNFTDGVGRISSELMEEVYKKLKLPKGQKPSAIQVRYGGCKGMLTLDDTLEGKKVLFRESQWKYDSTATSLEILKFSTPRQVYLNRPFITILDQMGVQRNVFINLQSKMLESLLKSLFRSDEATKLLKEKALIRLPYAALNRAGFDLSLEPFFRPMVMALYRSSIETLKQKARILIPFSEGRTMFGVVDETGTLQYGQIFVQYTEEMEDGQTTNKTHILKETVLVTKNPCMHPGDVRKFQAVDVKALHHIRDCLVFPSKGHRPHPDEMAGSDLDGDEYCVIWHKDLYFERDNHEAMDYSNPAPENVDGERVFSVDDDDLHRIKKMGKFFCYYIRSDAVGLIASAHLAWADKLSIFDEKCMAVAKKFSVTLDFAKSGQPTDLTPKERVHTYPDFMEKFAEKKTYLSTRALGELYRNCRRIDLASLVLGNEVEVELDQDLIIDGFEAYEEGAKKAFENFKNSMEEPCKMFCLTNEGELMSGAIITEDKFLKGKNTKENMEMSLGCYIPKVFKKMRENFFEEFRSKSEVENLCNMYMEGDNPIMKQMNPPLALYIHIQRLSKGYDRDAGYGLEDVLTEVFKKASAWYQVAYLAKKSGSSIFLGLPWTISEVLLLMKRRVHRVDVSKKFAFEDRLQSFIREERGKICTFLGVAEKDPDLKIVEALLLKWLRHHARTISLRSGHHEVVHQVFQSIFQSSIENKRDMPAARILGEVLYNMARLTFTTAQWEDNLKVDVGTATIHKELGLLSVMALANLSSTGRLWGKAVEPNETNFFGCSFLDDKYREELHMSLDTFKGNSADMEFVDCIKKHENEFIDLQRRWSRVDEVQLEFKETVENSDRWFCLLSIFGKRLNIELLKDILIGERFRLNVVTALKQELQKDYFKCQKSHY